MAGKRTKVGKTGVPIHGSALKASRLCKRTAAIKAERNRVNYLASEMDQGFTSASILIKRKTDR
jgi:hypothetical protein